MYGHGGLRHNPVGAGDGPVAGHVRLALRDAHLGRAVIIIIIIIIVVIIITTIIIIIIIIVVVVIAIIIILTLWKSPVGVVGILTRTTAMMAS
jgi:hypothetical protein